MDTRMEGQSTGPLSHLTSQDATDDIKAPFVGAVDWLSLIPRIKSRYLSPWWATAIHSTEQDVLHYHRWWWAVAPFHNGQSSACLSPFGGHVNGRCLTPHWSSLDSSGLLPGPRILGILFDRCRLVVVVIQKSSIDHPQHKKAKNSRFGQTDMDQWWRPQLAVAVHIPCQHRQFPYRAAISAQDENRMGWCRSRTNTVPHHPHYFIIYVCPVNNR